jgi:hypothetical protein
MAIFKNNNGSSKAGSNGASSFINFDQLALRARTSVSLRGTAYFKGTKKFVALHHEGK